MFKRLHGNTSCVPVLSLSVTARRGYRTMPNFTTDHEVASATQILGLDPDLAVSDKEVKAAFLRELRKLSRKPEDNPTGLAHQKPSIANYHSATLTDCVPNVKIHSSEDDRSRRIRKLVAAYKFMLKGGNGARVRYAQFDAVTPDGLLGEIKLESPFSNHDSRHQEFAFSDPSALPLTERRIDATPGGKWRKSAAGVRPGDPSVPGTTVDFRLSLTFQEALVGCTKTLRLTRDVSCKACEGSGDAKSASRKCSSCKGRGRFEVPSGTYLNKKDCVTCGASGKIPAPLCKPCAGTGMTLSEVTLSVTIPPGAKTGTVIKLRGEGNAGLRGGKAGDLAVTVLVAAHRVLHRVQDDLHVALPVPLSTALLGGKIEVPKADGGTIQVAVPPGVSSGYTISVPGLGAPRAGTKDHFGDLRVHLIVLIPDVEKLTKTQRHAMHLFQTTEEPIPLSVDVLAEAKAQFRHWLPMANAGD